MLKRTEKNKKSFLPRTLPGQFIFGNLCLRIFFKNPEKISKILKFSIFEKKFNFFKLLYLHM